MADNIYNFFDFLKKKAGKTLSPEKEFYMKLQHAKELITDKELAALSLKDKIRYYPEKLTKQDLTVDGNLAIPQGTTKIPEGLVVKGELSVPSSISEVTNNVQAQSVDWKASSDYYPKSFNGATFQYFRASFTTLVKTLPQNIKAIDTINVEYSSLQTLPEGIKARRIMADSTKLQTLPSHLECNILNIRNTKITEIPQGVIVHEQLTIDQLPQKYPQRLEDILAIGGGATIAQLREYEKLPQISASVGRKTKKGKGLQIPLADVGSKEYIDFVQKYKNKYHKVEDVTTEIEAVAKGAGQLFDITFTTVFLFAKHKQGFNIDIMLQGKHKDNTEVLVTPEAIITSEGEVSTKSYNRSWSPSERQFKEAMAKLFPQSYQGEKPVKAVNIRTLMNGPQSKEVHWVIGRKNRSGIGVEGNAKDLIPSLSGVTQDNIARYTSRGIKWDKMIVFDNNGAINLVIHGINPQGDHTYFDKTGYGQGAKWDVYTGPKYEDLT